MPNDHDAVRDSLRSSRWYAAVLVVVGVLVWGSGIDGVFLYDDYDSITLNPHIRKLWPLSQSMSRPLAGAAETVSTRPLLSLTFALNYAVHGLDVRGFHAVNIAIHLACALLLFGFLRRTLSMSDARGGWPAHIADLCIRPDAFAFVVALLWLVHPLNTSSVTYIVQRAEALGGLFVVLALYACARTANRGSSFGWQLLAVAACWLGAGAKETIAAAPLLALFYFAIFADGSYRVALARRGPLLIAMATSWIVLWMLRAPDTAALAEGEGLRYAATQPGVLLSYLRLALWPQPLAMSYDRPLVGGPADAFLPLLVIGALIAATAYGLVRQRWWGFAGAVFFGILAPSSTVFALTQRLMEHRSYLPLAVIITLLVAAFSALLARVFSHGSTAAPATSGAQSGDATLPSPAPFRFTAAAATLLLALGLAALTVARNRDYADEVRFWADNAAVQPGDSIAHLQLGRAQLRAGQDAAARASFERSLSIDPAFAPAHNDLARTLIAGGDLDGAVAALERALAIDPTLAVAHSNLALLALRRGDPAAAETGYRRALELDPSLAVAHEQLAEILVRKGEADEALDHFAAATGAERRDAQVNFRLAALLERAGNLETAGRYYERAATAAPDDLAIAIAYATFLARLGQDDDALRRFAAVLADDPDNVEAHANLGALHASRGRAKEAIVHFEQALKADPDPALVHFNLGLLNEQLGNLTTAIDEYRRETEISPQFAPAEAALARVLEATGKHDEAAAHYEAALRIAPDFDVARHGLDRLRARAGAGS